MSVMSENLTASLFLKESIILHDECKKYANEIAIQRFHSDIVVFEKEL